MTRGGTKPNKSKSDAASARSTRGTAPNDAPGNDTTASNPMRAIRAIAVGGAVLRFAICVISWGTNDTLSFARFAYDLHRHGLLAVYRDDPLLNHPPLVAGWCMLALALARGSSPVFAIVFRVPVILADAASAVLLGKIALERGVSPYAAKLLAAGYAFNLCAVLISGYHCNTDPVYAMLSLLAVYLLQDRQRPLLAGLVLGLSINVKLIPVLLIPPLCLAARSWRELLAFVGGLALMAIPFLPPLILEPAFARNLLAYRSQLDNWGITLLLCLVTGKPLPDTGPPSPDHPAAVYYHVGPWLVLALIAAWSVLARALGRWDRYYLAAATFALFLVFASGFGMQYLVIVAPLLYVAAGPSFANAYGLAAGAFALLTYWFFYDKGFPLSSLFNVRISESIGFVGLTAWALLAYFLVRGISRGAFHEAVAKGGGK